MLDLLFDNGASADKWESVEFASNTNGYSPLSYAVAENKIKVLDYLVGKGADVNSSGGLAAFNLAVRENNTEAVKFFIKHGVNMNVRGISPYDCYWSNLSLAIKEGYLEIAKLMIENGADVNLCNDADCYDKLGNEFQA